MIRVALVAWLGYALPHFIYHTTLTEHFSSFDNVGQLGSLGLQVLLPLVLLYLLAQQDARADVGKPAEANEKEA